MALQKIESVSDPIINTYYLVACVVTKYGVAYPILPIFHEDKEFAPNIGQHYHYDLRFKQPSYFKQSECRTNMIHEVKEGDHIEYRRRKLLRRLTGLHAPAAVRQYREWAEGMIGKPCKGGLCPHRGARMIVLEDGTYQCPMHNLISDGNTIISYEGRNIFATLLDTTVHQ